MIPQLTVYERPRTLGSMLLSHAKINIVLPPAIAPERAGCRPDCVHIFEDPLGAVRVITEVN